MSTYLQGAALGFSIAAPVGPIGLLCIRRTLTQGRSHGFATGMGAATADALYGCVAAFGFTVIAKALVEQTRWLQLVGALFLLYIAYKTFRSNAARAEAQGGAGSGYWRSYGSTLLLTLTNPMTILSFLGLFAGLNIGEGTSSALWLVLGVFSGSAAWWLLLSFAVGTARRKVGVKALRAINIGSALVLFVFGLHGLYEALRVGF